MPFNMSAITNFFSRRPTERRKYLRLDARIPVNYFVIPRAQEEEINNCVCYCAQSRNLSAGGLLLEVPLLQDEFFFTTHLIKVELKLKENSCPLSAVARMVSVEKPKNTDIYYMRLEFINIDASDRQKIINFTAGKNKR